MSESVMQRSQRILLLKNQGRGGDEHARVARILAEGNGAYEILLAGDAREALLVFATKHPDLVIVSAHDMDEGREICREIRRREGKRHTGIIFVACRDADEDRLSVECLEMGADDFLRHNCSREELLARVKAVLRLKAMTDELRSANHRLRVLSLTDELTGLANMRNFNQRYGEMIRRCRKGKSGLGVIMLDLDRFKSVNDSANHLVGSFVISEMGRLIRQADFVGKRDVAARYGGDEFILACEADSPAEMIEKAESLRRLVEQTEFRRDGIVVRITASVGFAWTDKGFDGRAEDLIKAADLMLYRSKEHGRNRVSGMRLRYPTDLESVSRSFLIEGTADELDDLLEVG